MGHGHVHGGKALLWTILLNIIITLAEYIGGIMTGSLALISDAGHNLSDVISLVLSYVGEKVYHKKPSHKFSFGLKRFEVLTALVNALTLWLISAYIIFEAFQRYVEPREIIALPMLGIAFIGLFGNVLSIVVLHASKDHNINLKAAFLHLFYDAISSVGVIIGAVIIIFTDMVLVDLVISIMISIMIFWSGFDIVREAIGIFMQSVPRGMSYSNVREAILSFSGVASVHDLHIWSLSSNEVILSCHICLSGKEDTDKLIKSIESKLSDDFGVRHSTIQIEKDDICNSIDGEFCSK